MRRKQKLRNANQPYLPGLEDLYDKEVPSTGHPESEEANCREGELLERILELGNLRRAYARVKSNRGKGGIDGMQVTQMYEYFKEHADELWESIRNEMYRPQPVKRVKIPKPDGGERLLGIPTIVDRVIQQAIAQVLTEIYEPLFSDSSYGFRPGRSCGQAITRAKELYEQGYVYVVDIDMAKYFDTVNHDVLISLLRRVIKDERVIRLIRRFLQSGVMENGLFTRTEKGTPQGGPLSPLLSNIYLTEFDRELEKRGHQFARYADDCNIYVKSQRAAERVLRSCTRFLEGKLRLTVNQQKSSAGTPTELKFLGFRLHKSKRGKVSIVPHPKSIKRFNDRIREITRPTRGVTLGEMLAGLRTYTQGWLGYYGIGNLTTFVMNWDGWIRHRIRKFIWEQWKTAKKRFEQLCHLGLDKERAYPISQSRRGSWFITHCQTIQEGLSNFVLRSFGYFEMTKCYQNAVTKRNH